MSTTALDVDTLNVSLGGQHILHDVSFTIAPGELVGLIGPNGAGKTTLMRAIMGLVPPHKDARIVRDESTPIGYVPQRQELDWSYPIGVTDLVSMAFLGTMRRNATERLEASYRALMKVGMYDYRNRTISQMSGGQKQRVLVARALVANPRILLLDEPFTGLDHPNQDSLSRLFVKLADDGVAILMSTHDLTQAVDICDRLIMLNRSVCACGSPAELTDPSLWMKTFEVHANSALLRSLGMVKR